MTSTKNTRGLKTGDIIQEADGTFIVAVLSPWFNPGEFTITVVPQGATNPADQAISSIIGAGDTFEVTGRVPDDEMFQLIAALVLGGVLPPGSEGGAL